MRIIIFLVIALSVLLVSCSVKEQVKEPATNTVPQSAPVVQKNTTTAQAITTTTKQKIACYSDSDCGVRTVENAYCFQGNPVGDLYTPRCENPGTAQAKCTEEHKSGIIAECGDTYFCYKGECVKYANCTDSDGGLNFTVKGIVKTNDNNAYEDKCDGDTLIEYYCSSDDRAFSEEERCADKCSRGACVTED